MAESIYIHIPFCRRKCGYCSFTSFEELNLKNIYMSALYDEILEYVPFKSLVTIYIGGGTPSLLSISDIEGILNLTGDATEITIEMNPENVNREYVKELKKIGINRLSIGVQSFDDEILKAIGRKHTVRDVFNVFDYARGAGFDNISIDLIYGLPAQNIDVWKKTLNEACALQSEHISLYGLKIDKGCNFYENRPNFLPDEDIQADMYLAAVEKLNLYEHYEISNWAKKGFESQHNLNYWHRGDYFGFGAAACGFLNQKRYCNTKKIEEYIKNPTGSKTYEDMETADALFEEIFLNFRLMKGIDVQKINSEFKINFEKKFALPLAKFIQSGHILKTPQGYKLSIEGILLSNEILCEFSPL